MNKITKDLENKGFLKAFLKNEYPRYMSKDFSNKVILAWDLSLCATVKPHNPAPIIAIRVIVL